MDIQYISSMIQVHISSMNLQQSQYELTRQVRKTISISYNQIIQIITFGAFNSFSTSFVIFTFFAHARFLIGRHIQKLLQGSQFMRVFNLNFPLISIQKIKTNFWQQPCSKHSNSLSQFQKHLSVLELYFSLLVFNDSKNKHQISKDENQRHMKENINKNKNNNTKDAQRLKESYNRFLKHNSNERGQNIKALKTCFQISNCNTNQNQKQQMIINLKKKPEYFILFCEQKQKALLLLEMNYQDMMEIENVFNIYLSLFELKCWDQVEMDKICFHLEKFILSTEFSKLSITPEICVKVKNYLGKQIQRQNPIYCYLFLYFACLSSQFTKIKSQNYGISFNKYSKLLKILDMVQFDSEIVSILKIIVCKCCQKQKKQILNDGKCIPEAGQIAFIKIIYKKAEEWINKSNSNFGISQNFKNSFQFVKYSYFQILCMNGRGEQLEQIIDQESDVQLQQLYINSEFIPKKLKLLLLRKMFKNNLMAANSTISLNDMKQLILLAESMDESFIYVSSTIKMFGEKGKRFISILAQQNERVGELCLRIFNSEHL